MYRKIHLLFLTLPFIACGNEKKADATTGKTAEDHASHPVNSQGNYCDSVNNGLITADTLKGSPHRTAMATINGTHVHIEYNSPGVKGRTIWGGLVGFDRVWASGAHKATSVQFSKDVRINEKKIPAGTYAFFTIPGKDKWIVILNTRFDQHLADDYNEKEDVARLEVKPATIEMTQRLTYSVEKRNETTGVITMRWEKLEVQLPFETTL